MAALDPEYMTVAYSCKYRGIAGPGHDPEDYPMHWTATISAAVWDDEDDDGDGEEVQVGEARFSIVPDAGEIDLFYTLDAVDQELANVAEMLTTQRPDLLDAADLDLGGDLLVLSSLYIDPKFRGNKTGHAILAAVGRDTAMVVLQAAPVLTEDGPQEGSPEHAEAKAALRRYWTDYGFQEADGDYLVLVSMSDLFDTEDSARS